MKIRCPNCNHEWIITVQNLNNEVLHFKIKYEGDCLQAKTVGGIISNMDKLLKASAKEFKDKICVMFGGIEQGDHEMDIKFLVLDKAGGGDKEGEG